MHVLCSFCLSSVNDYVAASQMGLMYIVHVFCCIPYGRLSYVLMYTFYAFCCIRPLYLMYAWCTGSLQPWSGGGVGDHGGDRLRWETHGSPARILGENCWKPSNCTVYKLGGRV